MASKYQIGSAGKLNEASDEIAFPEGEGIAGRQREMHAKA